MRLAIIETENLAILERKKIEPDNMWLQTKQSNKQTNIVCEFTLSGLDCASRAELIANKPQLNPRLLTETSFGQNVSDIEILLPVERELSVIPKKTID